MSATANGGAPSVAAAAPSRPGVAQKKEEDSKDSNPSSSRDSSHNNLPLVWKALANNLVKATHRADKAAAAQDAAATTSSATNYPPGASEVTAVDDCVKEYLAVLHYKWGRLLTATQAALEGQEDEYMALQQYVRTTTTIATTTQAKERAEDVTNHRGDDAVIQDTSMDVEVLPPPAPPL